jgi:hypothetical protein
VKKELVAKKGRIKAKKKGRIKAKINVPGINLDINVSDSAASLRELRKIIDVLNEREKGEQQTLELEPTYAWGFSDELRNSRGAMEFVRQAQCAEEGTLYKKLSIDNVKVFDTFKKEQYSQLNQDKAKDLISKELKFSNDATRMGMVHIISTVSKDDKAFLIDTIKKQLGAAELRTQFTHKDVLGKTVLEFVLFGAFPKREEF